MKYFVHHSSKTKCLSYYSIIKARILSQPTAKIYVYKDQEYKSVWCNYEEKGMPDITMCCLNRNKVDIYNMMMTLWLEKYFNYWNWPSWPFLPLNLGFLKQNCSTLNGLLSAQILILFLAKFIMIMKGTPSMNNTSYLQAIQYHYNNRLQFSNTIPMQY